MFSLERTYWHKEGLNDNVKPPASAQVGEAQYSVGPKIPMSGPLPREEANLISSRLLSGLHAPIMDIDVPAYLLPSSTPGHSHLYIDKPMPWNDFKRILRVFERSGIVEKGYAQASYSYEMSTLRIPGQYKRGVENPPDPTMHAAIERIKRLEAEVETLTYEKRQLERGMGSTLPVEVMTWR